MKESNRNDRFRPNRISRRTFLKLAAGATLLAGCQPVRQLTRYGDTHICPLIRTAIAAKVLSKHGHTGAARVFSLLASGI